MKEEFASRFHGLFSAIQGVQGELKALTGRMTEAEDRISTSEDDVAFLKTQTASMKAAMEGLVLKIARRSNLRLVGQQREVICALFWKSGFLTCLVITTFPGWSCYTSGNDQRKTAYVRYSSRSGGVCAGPEG